MKNDFFQKHVVTGIDFGHAIHFISFHLLSIFFLFYFKMAFYPILFCSLFYLHFLPDFSFWMGVFLASLTPLNCPSLHLSPLACNRSSATFAQFFSIALFVIISPFQSLS